MRHRWIASVALFALASTIGVAVSPAYAEGPGEYRAVPLAVPSGSQNGQGSAINDRDEVVGAYTTAEGRQLPVLWRRGRMIDLGLPAEAIGFWALATDINNRGQVVGWTDDSDYNMIAFSWERGVMTTLGTLGGSDSFPTAVNNRGAVVGLSHDGVASQARTFLWRRGVMTDLGAFYASDINDSGTVVGSAYLQGRSVAVVWRRGRLTQLHRPFADASGLAAVNNLGWMVGTETTNGVTRALLWRNDTVTELAPTWPESMVVDINDRGQVLGYRFSSDGRYHWFIWERGQLTELADRGIPAGPSIYLASINNRGHLAGTLDNDAVLFR